jgi:hypothetical protein
LDYVDVPAPASAYVIPAAFSGEFVDKVITAESSGNVHARPCDAKTGKLLSSAYGAGQFVEATWLEMIRKHRPDLAARSDEDILGLRGDFALSREMTVKFTEENRTYLIKHGFDPTDAALYLAHFAGKTGAVKLLKAHRDTPVEKILSPEAIEANHFLKGQTPATLYAWAGKKMNVEVSPLVRQARVSASKKVTRHAEIPGCGAKPAKDDAKTAPKAPDREAKPPKTIETRTVTAEASPPEESRLSRAVRLVVGGVVKYATGA